MMTRSSSSLYGINDSLSPTDRELFSLFLQYPEIDFDSQHDATDPESTGTAQSPDLDSSPLATATEATSNASTLVDTSESDTTLTTPIRPPNDGSGDADDAVAGDWDTFVLLMQQSNLPEECLHYYTSLAHAMIRIGTDLFATARPNRPSQALPVGQWLLKDVTYSMNQAATQVDKIAHLKTLTAFNVTPTGSYLWTTYMQRAKLITGNLALPCKHELDFVQSLVHIYDTYVYSQFIQTLGLNLVGEQTCSILNDVYHNLMKWLHNYNQWCKGMSELRNTYMRSLIDEFAKLPEAQDEFNEFQERITKAKSALTRSIESTADLSDKIVQRLNLSARRKDGSTGLKRSRTRYKREHTL